MDCEHFAQVDFDGILGAAVEAEHGPADLSDAGDFLLREVEKMSPFFFVGDPVHQEEEVGDGVKGIVNLVSNGGCKASGDGKLFGCDQGILGLLSHRDIAKDEDDTNEERRVCREWVRHCLRRIFRCHRGGGGRCGSAGGSAGWRLGDAVNGVLDGFARGFVEDGKHVGERTATRFLLRSSR